MFRTRQAPSPTGYLHIGTARTVLFTKLLAATNNGEWYLRLEDTDRSRLQPETVKVLLDALGRIGLEAQEGISLTTKEKSQVKDDFYGVYQNGNFGPYIQSLRTEIYQQHAQNLIDRGLAYWSYLTSEDKEELQQIKQAAKKPIDYFSICQNRFSEKLTQNVEQGLSDSAKPSLMYKLQRNSIITCQDELLGESKFDLSLEEDFNILKSDGFPTYHLAHLVDDHLMETSLVIRTQEWLPSLSRHIQMFIDYYGQESVPKYMHVPFILGTTGNKKMSKRDGNVNMALYLQQGYTEEALINYLAFLGWNPGTEQELFLNQEDFDKIN